MNILLARGFTSILFILFNFSISAQSNLDSAKKNSVAPLSVEEKLRELKGTIQIQIKDPRFKPNIPYDIDEIVIKNRKQNMIVYFSIGEAVRIKILPSNQARNENLELISTYN